MRVLGIDPGSRFMGYGVVEERRGRLVHVGHGVIKVDPDAPLELRLKELHGGLLTAVKLYKPQAVAVEGVFTFRNARSALILGHARGVALLAAAQAGLSVYEYPPARVKRAVGAGGAADKDAVARMVCTFLEVEVLDRADASDALAVAICHLNHGRSAVPVSGAKPSKTRRKSAQAQLADKLTPSYRRPEAR
ncbi:crossover junction endodeoxyribonuclease RuvC [Archangium gephyra]|uniref:crossover junction endodeoxyribonuclease RuvC n=1 Tax=Archangium gephyra TaxID=48 RepID=UPI0035D4B402